MLIYDVHMRNRRVLGLDAIDDDIESPLETGITVANTGESFPLKK